eukprot:gnl/Spiro4/2689_TR1298_c0_g1_i1.p2 gnl/Spiro4/2689_TR1298_c0_g1~~gnl/Spiro4/2689_TR1298_c0_g1_i1.p2  ORF type:complete len:445 (+),score=119.53 gnl/Spiro4/2689_TR1298_c0_g1_i1:79-1335(+)
MSISRSGKTVAGNTNLYADKMFDRFPDHKAAGMLTAPTATIAELFRQPIPESARPQPKKFLYKNVDTIGTSTNRFDNRIPDCALQRGFGKPTDRSTTARDAVPFKPEPESRAVIADVTEAGYASKLRPVGRSRIVKNNRLPDRTNDPNFRFGSKTRSSETAGELLFPVGSNLALPSDADCARQTIRNYNWDITGVDPVSHRFGKYEPRETDLVKKSIMPEEDPLVQNQTISVQYESVNRRRLAESGLAGHNADPNMPPAGSRVFYNDHGTQHLVRGDFYATTAADNDVGRRRVTTCTGHWRVPDSVITPDTRAAGVPVIRTDRQPPNKKSVNDTNNYGYDPDIRNLLQPPSRMPFFDECKELLYTKDQMAALCGDAGLGLDDAAFETVWTRASGGRERVTTHEFRASLNAYSAAQIAC